MKCWQKLICGKEYEFLGKISLKSIFFECQIFRIDRNKIIGFEICGEQCDMKFNFLTKMENNPGK